MGRVHHEVGCAGDERGSWFGFIVLCPRGFPELDEGFLSERLGIEFPREIEVIEVAFEFSTFFTPIMMYGGVIGLVIEREHVGHVLVVVPQFMK